jgi:hypothetical protein
MAGLVPAIHDFEPIKIRIADTRHFRPGMTDSGKCNLPRGPDRLDELRGLGHRQ